MKKIIKYSVIFSVGKLIVTISKWQSSKFIPLRWLGLLLILPIYWLLGDKYYSLLITVQNHKRIELRRTSRIPSFFIQALTGDSSASIDKYIKFLVKTSLAPDIQYKWSHRFLANGRLDLARVGFLDLINRQKNKLPLEKQLHVFREMGIVCFMLGRNSEANHYWKLAGEFRRILFKPQTTKKYRILGSAWFAAIGHIAMLDYYLKFKKLHVKESQRIVAELDVNSTPSPDLLHKFLEMGIELISPGGVEKDYNKWAKRNAEPKWDMLSDAEKAALVDDFWEFDFPDGEILGYAGAAARIQKEWEQQDRAPLFFVTDREKRWLTSYRASLGIPQDAWFVCLHVREAGFHQQWNSFYPTMRDASIEDYFGAIEQIVKTGGWVLRMGDSSMKPLPPLQNVIDYAHSPLKTPCADILLAASCRFFLGTNSGYATISAIYNIPCAFSNWIPIGWPLWPSQNLMIPKLFREKKSGRFLTLEEIFARGLAFIQNWSDLSADIELVDNTAEEITQLTVEMLSHCKITAKKDLIKTGTPAVVLASYSDIAKRYEAFTGSQIARTFVEKYAEVFSFYETRDDKGNKIKWNVQSNDNMTVTSN